jgi:periplasmic protein TonB
MGRVVGIVLGVVGAATVHGAVLAFGGILLPGAKENESSLQEVELMSEDEAAADDKKEEEEPKPEVESEEELETEEEEAPDAAEIIRSLDLDPLNSAPALEEASLSQIEDALRGNAPGGDEFATALGFASGGRIGGTGKAGALEESLDGAFSMAEIDQKPRPIFQAAPLYPADMRGKKLEGLVTVVFIVDASGKVTNPRVEKSSHPSFERPALEAVRQWKFEPAVKGGQRVGCKMRVPIRFQPS